jgi:hypothetical protein
MKLSKLKNLFTTPPSNGTDNTDVSRNILAFRTITTMLARIQQQSLTLNDIIVENQSDRQKLRILNALATVMVVDHEVVAVVTSPVDSTQLNVLACKAPPHSTTELIPPSNQSTTGHLWKLLVSGNPRLDSQTSVPCLRDPEIPVGLGTNPTTVELMEYVNARW